VRDLLLEVVVHAPAPEAPAEGIHWRLGERYGFLPPPRGVERGDCWWCGKTAVLRLPLCQECSVELWGEGPIRATTRRQVPPRGTT